MDPKKLLFLLLGAIPLVVLGAGALSFVLLRAGYGFLVWAVLPFLGALLVGGVLGLVLGRAASGRHGPDGSSGDGRYQDGDKPRKRNDV